MSRFDTMLRQCWAMEPKDERRVLTRFVAKLDYLDERIESVSMSELADRLKDAIEEVNMREAQPA